MYKTSLEIEATIIEVDEAIHEIETSLNDLGHSGLTQVNGEYMFVCMTSEERMCLYATLDSYSSLRMDLQGEWMTAHAAELEATRRKCTPEEVIALWEGKCTYIPDYDDHSSDDARAEQDILREVGMNIQANPLELRELDL